MNISNHVLDVIKSRYHFLPPIVVEVTCRYSNTLGDIFKTLDNLPEAPYFWDDVVQEWRPAFGLFEAHQELEFRE